MGTLQNETHESLAEACGEKAMDNQLAVVYLATHGETAWSVAGRPAHWAYRSAPNAAGRTQRQRIAVEQASTFEWEGYVGICGWVIGMNTFGASAPLNASPREFGFEPDTVAAVAKELLGES